MHSRSSAWARNELRLSFSEDKGSPAPPRRPGDDARRHVSRTTRVPRVTTGGGALARTADGSRVAVAGRDSLRILKVSTPDDNGAPRFESSRNYCDSSGVKAESANTDIVWARGLYSSKLLTGARNGELRLWDLHKNGPNKLENSARSHLRAIHKLALSTHLPHYCITGSADGDLRAWDLRDLHRSVLRLPFSTAVRAAVFSPDNTHALQIALGLDDGSLHRWDLRMGARGSLDRLPVAHVGPIMSLDWVPATGAPASSPIPMSTADADGMSSAAVRDGIGWIASAGLDKTVKIWSANSGGALPTQPFYTLASVYPVRRVQFRPGHATELVTISNVDQTTLVDDTPAAPQPVAHVGHVVHVWDVRRENLPKYLVMTPVPDGGASDVVWGSSKVIWAQHASGAFAQLDCEGLLAPLNVAVRSTVAWGATRGLAFALDTVHDRELPFDDRDEKSFDEPKALGEPPFRPITQSIGALPQDDEDAEQQDALIACAKGYRIHEFPPKDACLYNAMVSEDAGKLRAAQVWHFAATLLEDIVPFLPAPAAPHPHPLVHSISAPSGVPTISPPAAKPPTRRSTTASEGMTSESAAKRILSSNNPASRRSSPGMTPSPNGSPSPLRRSINLPMIPLVPLLEPLTFSRPGSVASTPLRERPSLFRYPSGFDPNARRPSLTPSLLSATSFGSPNSGERPPSSSFTHRVGQGALDDSSDEEDAAADAGDEHDDDDDDDPSTPMRTPLSTKPPTFSDLSSRTWASSVRDEEGSSSDGIAPLSSFQRRGSIRRKKGRRPSFGDDGLLAAPRLSHQMSTSSINTVIAAHGNGDRTDVRTASSRARSMNLSMDHEGAHSFAEDRSAEDAFMRLPRDDQDLIVAEEEKLREMGWRSLQEDLDSLADEGDVQTAAILGIICRKELHLGRARLLHLVRAYIDILSRLQLFASAAYLRKHAGIEELRSDSALNTTIYSACARCRKPIVMPAPHVGKTTDGRPSGAFSFCIRCQRFMTCSVCHLPVKGLAAGCGICGHGGHWACFRRLAAEPPAVVKEQPAQHEQPHASLHSPSRSRANSDLVAGSPNLERLLAHDRAKEAETEAKVVDKTRPALVGHPCVAGCGHWCMLGTRRE